MAAAAPPQDGRDAQLLEAGAPLILPEEYKGLWLEWSGAKASPSFAIQDGKLVLQPSAKLILTYAPFMQLGLVDGELTATCLIQGCSTKAGSEGMRLTFNGKVTVGNFVGHLWRSHGRGALVTAQDHAGFLKDEEKAEDRATGAKKRARKEKGEEGVVALPSASASEVKSDFIKAVARWLTQDTLPWNVVEGGGFREFCTQNTLPIVGRTAVSDA